MRVISSTNSFTIVQEIFWISFHQEMLILWKNYKFTLKLWNGMFPEKHTKLQAVTGLWQKLIFTFCVAINEDLLKCDRAPSMLRNSLKSCICTPLWIKDGDAATYSPGRTDEWAHLLNYTWLMFNSTTFLKGCTLALDWKKALFLLSINGQASVLLHEQNCLFQG